MLRTAGLHLASAARALTRLVASLSCRRRQGPRPPPARPTAGRTLAGHDKHAAVGHTAAVRPDRVRAQAAGEARPRQGPARPATARLLLRRAHIRPQVRSSCEFVPESWSVPHLHLLLRVNTRVPASPASNREEQESSSSSSSQPRSFEDTPIRPSKSSVPASRKEPSPEDVPIRAVKRQPAMAAGAAAGSRIPAPSSHRHSNNNHGDDEEEPDALDALSRRFPKKKAPPPSPHADDYEPAPLEPGTATFITFRRSLEHLPSSHDTRVLGSLG